MSKPEIVKTNQKDIYSVWSNNVESYYSNLERSIPKFHQAATSLMQEYIKAWNNAATSLINIQHEFAAKAGIKSNLPESALKVVHDTTEDLNKVIDVQNSISIASIDTAKQNIKTWNENSSAFAELNKGIVESLVSTMNTKN